PSGGRTRWCPQPPVAPPATTRRAGHARGWRPKLVVGDLRLGAQVEPTPAGAAQQVDASADGPGHRLDHGLLVLAGTTAHGGDARFWSALHHAIEAYPELPVVLHLDHGPDPQTCLRAMDSGFTSVMIDGSLRADGTPAAFADNLAVTALVAEQAHRRGVSVEGELGTIGGAKTGGTRTAVVLADPAQAKEFVAATNVDALAVAIGTSHGAYKFPAPPDGSVLRMDLIAEIAAVVPQTHLVMHGSSSLPPALREQNNRFGADLPESW